MTDRVGATGAGGPHPADRSAVGPVVPAPLAQVLEDAFHDAYCPRHAGSVVPHSTELRGYEPCAKRAKALAALVETTLVYDEVNRDMDAGQAEWWAKRNAWGRAVDAYRATTR